ncbi:histone deacetylase 5 isoform X2 [Humulus lupulus]|uniref:histone deacetylase 5 isoform X2 n=1 Tax=Humulus lupulus TaxID=3486 RepID=UPI002B413E5A|nr:histone deacetylase 5 isoform X2 [Humulus lupulus]
MADLRSDSESKTEQRRVGLLYDERMCKHHTPDHEDHPENPNRIKATWKKLHTAGIPQRCVLLNAKEVEDKHVLLVHSQNHLKLIKNISSKQFDSRRARTASRYNSIYFNDGSSEAASLAAGSVIEVTERVAKGELNSGVAIVRPPGHHAEHDEPMGFCLYNNVAIATKFLLNEKPELGIERVLIVDWDVHHGNGTQKMFWEDPRVLFFSVHRHEFGSFYPANDDGFYTMVGEGPGAGYNINVPWENGQCGDADYLAVWDHILIPVAKEFNPDIIIVSAGFDAAVNDPLGGCCVTPSGYSIMLKKLMDFAHGKVVLALEGGYNLESIANSTLACVEVLLEDKLVVGSAEVYPFDSTWHVIEAVRQELSPFWPTLAGELPKKLTNQKAPLIPYVPSSSSDSEVEDNENPNVSKNLADLLHGIVEPLSKLTIDADQVSSNSDNWRSDLSKFDIWYASFGSNMWQPRFKCYIEGGQVEGMAKPCSGAVDKTLPKEILWKTFRHRLFFGRDFSQTWGPGGVAFVSPGSSIQEVYMCLYKITLEQFNDVLVQENTIGAPISSPLIDLTALNSFTNEVSNSLEVNLEV